MTDIYTPKIKVDDNGSVQDLNLNAYAVQGKVPSTETTANTIVVRDGQGRVPIVSSLQFPTEIPTNSNLNDYHGDDKLGWYYTNGWLQNFPGTIDRATILVCKNSNNEYVQIVYGIDDDLSLICPYIRIYRNNQRTNFFTILDVVQGDIPSADAFKNIRTTLRTPDVSTFLKVGRQTSWVDNSILAGMESAYNPVLMFGAGDGQAFIAVNRIDHIVSVGGGTGGTYAWNEILATQKFVDDNYVSLAGGDTINGDLKVNGMVYATHFRESDINKHYVNLITGNNIDFGITGNKSTVYNLAQNLIMGVNYLDATKQIVLSQSGPIGWGALSIESTTDDEVDISFFNKSADKRFALGIPVATQLPGYKMAIYDRDNAYGYGSAWLALATENWAKDMFASKDKSIGSPKELLTGDLNDYWGSTNYGVYYGKEGKDNNVSNAPNNFKGAFSLIVTGLDTSRTMQVFISGYTPTSGLGTITKIFIREHINYGGGSTEWTPWRELISSTGGTIEGVLNFSAGGRNINNICQDGDGKSGLMINSENIDGQREITVTNPSVVNTWTHVQFGLSSFPYGSTRRIASEEWITGQKGQANGIAPLNSEGKIDSTYLPPSEYVQKYAHHLTFKRIVEENNQILVFITFTIVNTQKDKYQIVTGLPAISQALSNQGFNAQERVSLAQGVWREGNTNDYLSVFGVYGALVAGTWKVNCVGITKNTANVTVYSLVWADFSSDVVVPL